ncbi:MAG: PcfJ domain-containing protein [Bacteroidota bacterium]
MAKHYLDQLLEKLDFSNAKERSDFLEELLELQKDDQLVLLTQESLIPDLLSIYLRVLSEQTAFTLALDQQFWLKKYFTKLLEGGLKLPTQTLALETFLTAAALPLKQEGLIEILSTEVLAQFSGAQLQRLQVTYRSNWEAIIDFMAKDTSSLEKPEKNLGVDVLLLMYPGLFEENTAVHLRQFLCELLPLYVQRFEHRMNASRLYERVDRVTEWFLLWQRHLLRKEADLEPNDAYYDLPFAQIIKYIPEYIWWNNGMTYRNNDKNYHFGSEGFRHLAAGGSVRKGPDPRPYTRRMAKAFVTLPYNFPYPDWDLYIYFFCTNHGAEGLLLEWLQEYIRHPREIEDLVSVMDRWTPVIQKLAALQAQNVGDRNGRRLMSYVYHCLRDQPYFSIQGRTLEQLLQLSEGFHQRIQERADLRAQRQRELLEAYEAHRNRRAVRSWGKHGTIQPFKVQYQGKHPFKIVELTSAQELSFEGSAMNHCVGTYTDACVNYDVSIWSLREYKKLKWYSCVTIEIAGKSIRQARGPFNANPTPEHNQIIRKWAEKEKLDWYDPFF